MNIVIDEFADFAELETRVMKQYGWTAPPAKQQALSLAYGGAYTGRTSYGSMPSMQELSRMHRPVSNVVTAKRLEEYTVKHYSCPECKSPKGVMCVKVPQDGHNKPGFLRRNGRPPRKPRKRFAIHESRHGKRILAEGQ